MARATSKKPGKASTGRPPGGPKGGAAGADRPEAAESPAKAPRPAGRSRRAAVPAAEPRPTPAGTDGPDQAVDHQARAPRAGRESGAGAGRQADDLRTSLDALAREAGETRARMELLRAEVDQTRRELDEARRQVRAAVDEMSQVLGATAAAREQAGRTDAEAVRQAAVLAGHLRVAREQWEALSPRLEEARTRPDVPADPGKPGPAAGPIEAGPAPEAVGKNRLGVVVGPGVVVAEVRADAPGGAAGLALGDVIEGVNGRPVHASGDLRDAVHAVPAGGQATLRIIRAGAAEDRTAHRASPADGADDGPDWLGLTVDAGAVVAEVLPDSPAAAAGLRPGDVITRVNDDPVASGEQLRAAIHPLLPRAEVRLRLSHGARAREVILRLDDAPSVS